MPFVFLVGRNKEETHGQLLGVFVLSECKHNLLYEGHEPSMPPSTLPPGAADHHYEAKIKVAARDSFGSEGFVFVDVTVSQNCETSWNWLGPRI